MEDSASARQDSKNNAVASPAALWPIGRFFDFGSLASSLAIRFAKGSLRRAPLVTDKVCTVTQDAVEAGFETGDKIISLAESTGRKFVDLAQNAANYTLQEVKSLTNAAPENLPLCLVGDLVAELCDAADSGFALASQTLRDKCAKAKDYTVSGLQIGRFATRVGFESGMLALDIVDHSLASILSSYAFSSGHALNRLTASMGERPTLSTSELRAHHSFLAVGEIASLVRELGGDLRGVGLWKIARALGAYAGLQKVVLAYGNSGREGVYGRNRVVNRQDDAENAKGGDTAGEIVDLGTGLPSVLENDIKEQLRDPGSENDLLDHLDITCQDQTMRDKRNEPLAMQVQPTGLSS